MTDQEKIKELEKRIIKLENDLKELTLTVNRLRWQHGEQHVVLRAGSVPPKHPPV